MRAVQGTTAATTPLMQNVPTWGPGRGTGKGPSVLVEFQGQRAPSAGTFLGPSFLLSPIHGARSCAGLCWGLGTWWGSCAPDRPQRGWQRAQGPELGVGRQPLEPEASSEPCSLRWTSGRAPPTWGPSATCCHPRLGLRGHCAGENGVTLHGADLSPTLRGESRSWAQGGWGAHHPETGPLSIGFPDQGVVGPAQRGQWALAGVPVHAGLPAALHWPHLVQVPALLQG